MVQDNLFSKARNCACEPHKRFGLNSEYVAIFRYMRHLIHNGWFTEKGRYFIIARLCLQCQNILIPRVANSNVYSFDLPRYYMMELANLSQIFFFNLGPSYLILIPRKISCSSLSKIGLGKLFL